MVGVPQRHPDTEPKINRSGARPPGCKRQASILARSALWDSAREVCEGTWLKDSGGAFRTQYSFLSPEGSQELALTSFS